MNKVTRTTRRTPRQPVKPTPFITLAEDIADNIDYSYSCCIDLPINKSDFFESFFQPTYEERKEYNHCGSYWMRCHDESREQDNELRILALLFADQLWQERSNRKYKRI